MSSSLKYFIIGVGIWNIADGLLSLRAKALKHALFVDTCRVLRSILGLGLVIAGFLI